MGDPQLHMNPNSVGYVETAMKDLAEIPHDFLAILGDLVQNNPKYYEDYDRLVLQQAKKPVFSIAGNAELNAGLDAYQRCTGLPLYYAIYRRGIRFIFTSVTGGRNNTEGGAQSASRLNLNGKCWTREKATDPIRGQRPAGRCSKLDLSAFLP